MRIHLLIFILFASSIFLFNILKTLIAFRQKEKKLHPETIQIALLAASVSGLMVIASEVLRFYSLENYIPVFIPFEFPSQLRMSGLFSGMFLSFSAIAFVFMFRDSIKEKAGQFPKLHLLLSGLAIIAFTIFIFANGLL